MALFSEYTALSKESTASALDTSLINGLDAKEAEARLRAKGPNELGRGRLRWPEILLRQFKSSFVYLLVGAAAVSFFLQEPVDGSIILGFVLVNALLGFYQEYHSEKSVALLSQYITSKSAVIRSGKEISVSSRDLVAGEIVVLEAGGVVPADVRFVEAHDLALDESALTGESVAVAKTTKSLDAAVTAYYQAVNIGFSGTIVATGIGKGIVVATGRDAAIGEVAALAAASTSESSFQKGLDRFSTFILRLTLGTLALVFLAHLIIHRGVVNIGELAIFSIALGVSVIPEGLPVVTTFCLSRGALRLAKRNVVVKRLSAIEDLGGIEILCTDKTGTITENKMKVADIHGDRTAVLRYAALGGAWPSETIDVSTFDRPLWQEIPDDSQRELIAGYRKLGEIPFDPERKKNSVLLQHREGKTLVVRGAPEAILPFCDDQDSCAKLRAWTEDQGRLGRRVLAIAARLNAFALKEGYEPGEENRNLEVLGAVAFADPIKPSTVNAIAQAEKLGLAIKILTGDSKEVAVAVGKEAGLISDESEAITGQEFSALHFEAQHRAVEGKVIFARMSPEEKHRVVHLLQEKYSVGFMGDGINDAPALKVADVGLVVNGATDIAREAADVVLLQSSLEVIVNGIREGRRVFVNTVKYIKSTLSSNFGNFYAVAFGSLVMSVLPMLPLQILLLNLLSDSPMLAIAADRVDEDEVAAPQSYHIREITVLAVTLGVVSMIFDFIYFGLFYKGDPAVLQTNWFIGSIITELLFLFSVRTHKFFLKAKPVAPILGVLTLAALALTIGLPYTEFGRNVFHFTPPSLGTLGVIVGIALVYLATTEAAKLLYFRYESDAMKKSRA